MASSEWVARRPCLLLFLALFMGVDKNIERSIYREIINLFKEQNFGECPYLRNREIEIRRFCQGQNLEKKSKENWENPMKA